MPGSSRLEAKTIRCPSGDQLGWMSSPAPLVSCVWPLPSGFIVHRSPLRTKAILLLVPHVGWPSFGPAVSWRRSWPSEARTDQISVLDWHCGSRCLMQPRRLENTTRVLSGDHAGSSSSLRSVIAPLSALPQSCWDRSRTPVPSTLAMRSCLGSPGTALRHVDPLKLNHEYTTRRPSGEKRSADWTSRIGPPEGSTKVAGTISRGSLPLELIVQPEGVWLKFFGACWSDLRAARAEEERCEREGEGDQKGLLPDHGTEDGACGVSRPEANVQSFCTKDVERGAA